MTATYPGDADAGDPNPNPLVRMALAIERTERLDPLVRRIAPLAEGLVASPARRDLLQGRWLGHAVHPVLVTVPVGMWTAVSMLDLLRGESSRETARTLAGWSVLFAVPSAVTGWAEWADANQRDRRTATVHAVSNASAIALYVASWGARRRGRHARGAAMSAAALAGAGFGGFLGGHLTQARKVGSHHPALAGD